MRHAISSGTGQPLIFEPQELIFPIFSHEPTLASAPTGETAMFFTHNSQPVTFAGVPCNCTTGNSTLGSCPTDWDKRRGRDPSKALQTYMSFTNDFARWSTPVAVKQADPLTDTAFSATILRNGTLVAMTRTQVIVGRSWRDPSTYQQVATFKPNHYGEGADMWHDPTTGVPKINDKFPDMRAMTTAARQMNVSMGWYGNNCGG